MSKSAREDLETIFAISAPVAGAVGSAHSAVSGAIASAFENDRGQHRIGVQWAQSSSTGVGFNPYAKGQFTTADADGEFHSMRLDVNVDTNSLQKAIEKATDPIAREAMIQTQREILRAMQNQGRIAKKLGGKAS